MSTEENKQLVRRHFADWNAFGGDTAKIRPYYEKYTAPDFIAHSLSRGDLNREQRTQYVIATAPAMPDLTYTVEDLVAEGDKVVARYTMHGTHKGTFMGVPATGKQFTAKGVAIYRIKDGKIAESWDFPDVAGAMAQLGAGPGSSAKK